MSPLIIYFFYLQCSRKCGNGLKKRSVLCTSKDPGVQSTLPDGECSGVQKPASQESCFLRRCQKQRKVQWFVARWQQVNSVIKMARDC